MMKSYMADLFKNITTKQLLMLLVPFVLLMQMCSDPAIAQTAGRVTEQNQINSKILGRDVPYTLYLPPDYNISDRMYPVLYLLHGHGDDHNAWVQYAEINRQVDDAIVKGIIPPMIIVMPDAQTSFYMNSFDGKELYEDFFIKEFIPAVESKLRIRKDRDFRAVAGLSMGGFGSLLYAMKFPDLFGGCAALSAAVWNDEGIATMDQWLYDALLGGPVGKNLKEKNRLTKHWYANSPLKLVEMRPAKELKKVAFWIDCGDDDFLIDGNCFLHMALEKKGIPHEFRVRDGSHNWTYWRGGIIDALKFIGKKFRNS